MYQKHSQIKCSPKSLCKQALTSSNSNRSFCLYMAMMNALPWLHCRQQNAQRKAASNKRLKHQPQCLCHAICTKGTRLKIQQQRKPALPWICEGTKYLLSSSIRCKSSGSQLWKTGCRRSRGVSPMSPAENGCLCWPKIQMCPIQCFLVRE